MKAEKVVLIAAAVTALVVALTVAVAASASHVPDRTWDRLADCETGGDWQYRSPTGEYEGGLGFWRGSWDAYRPARYPAAAYNATRRQQIRVAHRILRDVGWSAWPGCSERLGLR